MTTHLEWMHIKYYPWIIDDMSSNSHRSFFFLNLIQTHLLTNRIKFQGNVKLVLHIDDR
jgi:hypothetical protein